MSRFLKGTKIIFLVGSVLASIFTVLIGYIAMDHDPMMEYSSDLWHYAGFLVIVFMWVFLPTLLLCGLGRKLIKGLSKPVRT